MRALLVVTALAITTSGAAQEPRSIVLCVDWDAQELLSEVALQMADRNVSLRPAPEGASFVERTAHIRETLGPHDTAVWLEPNGAETLLAALESTDEVPRTSPLPPRATTGWERVVALVIDGLISSEPLALRLSSPTDGWSLRVTEEASAEEAATVALPRPSGWPSPLARNGWMFRLGTLFTLSPRSISRFGAYSRDEGLWVEASGGLRLRVGRWLTRVVRVDVSGHLGKTWYDIGLESGFDVEVMAVSATRFRMGAGVGFGALVVGERDVATGKLFGWAGWWASLPLEIGFDFYRRSGLFIHIGPTLTKPSYAASPHPGLMMSVEAELDFGTFE